MTEQTSDMTLTGSESPFSKVTANRLHNLLELSTSELTTYIGAENLPVTEMLRDTILNVLGAVRPDLLAHSQRVAFLCHGIAQQCGWSSRHINTLTTTALLHEIGSVILPAHIPFWDLIGTELEDLSTRVTVDLLESCHADSEMLEILALSQNLRYRKPLSHESESPSPPHVVLGAAAVSFANLFDAVRQQTEGAPPVKDILATLKSVSVTAEEKQVVEALEEWLSGKNSEIETFEVATLQEQNLEMDDQTLAVVRETFMDILLELHTLEENYDGVFILDSTGRFQLWNYGCEERLGHSMRETRNKHWSNSLIGYSNQDGLAFSETQTPLHQTLKSAKPAEALLFLKDVNSNLVETQVQSVPIMGRDQLLMGIVELHLSTQETSLSESETPFTTETIFDLVSQLQGQQEDEDDEETDEDSEQSILGERYLLAIEEQLALPRVITPPEGVETEFDDQIESMDSSEVVIEDESDLIEEEPADSDSMESELGDTETVDQIEEQLPEDVSAHQATEEEPALEETALEETEEDLAWEPPIDELSEPSSDLNLSEIDEEVSAEPESAADAESEKLDDLFNRFDSLVADSSEDESESDTASEEEQPHLTEAEESLSESEMDVEENAIEESVMPSAENPESDAEEAEESEAAELQTASEPEDLEMASEPVTRQEWDEFVQHLINPESPDHEPVALLYLDIDRFKAINEGFGKQIGDDLITEISRRLSHACGSRELSCRYAGSQFAIASLGVNLEEARSRGDQFRRLVDQTRFDVLPFHSLTASVGASAYEENDDLDELMGRAEQGLFQAKRSGRNCVVALSSADIASELQEVEQSMSKLITKDFEIITEFNAMIPSDMIVYKLGGFLYDMHAKLLHVDPRHVSMRVGSKGFLPYWGRQDDDRPVLIDLELGDGWSAEKAAQGQVAETTIHVKIRPDGWVRNQDTFLKRANFVLRELKGFFVSN